MTFMSVASPSELRRLPGLYRRWELADVLQPNRQYCIEDAGCTDDGAPLLAVFEAEAALCDAPDHAEASAPRGTVSGLRE
jgi:hypothetical protein